MDTNILDLKNNNNIVLNCTILYPGVGSEDFSAMEELDSDDALLEDGRNTAARDIVQFVELQVMYNVYV